MTLDRYDAARGAHLSFAREQVETLRSIDVSRIMRGQIAIPLLREFANELAPDKRALTVRLRKGAIA